MASPAETVIPVGEQAWKNALQELYPIWSGFGPDWSVKNIVSGVPVIETVLLLPPPPTTVNSNVKAVSPSAKLFPKNPLCQLQVAKPPPTFGLITKEGKAVVSIISSNCNTLGFQLIEKSMRRIASKSCAVTFIEKLSPGQISLTSGIQKEGAPGWIQSIVTEPGLVKIPTGGSPISVSADVTVTASVIVGLSSMNTELLVVQSPINRKHSCIKEVPSSILTPPCPSLSTQLKVKVPGFPGGAAKLKLPPVVGSTPCELSNCKAVSSQCIEPCIDNISVKLSTVKFIQTVSPCKPATVGIFTTKGSSPI